MGGRGKISWRRDRAGWKGDVAETISGLSRSPGLNLKLEDEMRSVALMLVSDDALVKTWWNTGLFFLPIQWDTGRECSGDESGVGEWCDKVVEASSEGGDSWSRNVGGPRISMSVANCEFMVGHGARLWDVNVWDAASSAPACQTVEMSGFSGALIPVALVYGVFIWTNKIVNAGMTSSYQGGGPWISVCDCGWFTRSLTGPKMNRSNRQFITAMYASVWTRGWSIIHSAWGHASAVPHFPLQSLSTAWYSEECLMGLRMSQDSECPGTQKVPTTRWHQVPPWARHQQRTP